MHVLVTRRLRIEARYDPREMPGHTGPEVESLPGKHRGLGGQYTPEVIVLGHMRWWSSANLDALFRSRGHEPGASPTMVRLKAWDIPRREANR